MKTLILSLLLLPSTAMCQWRPVNISSKNYTGDIQENFRRASLWSNRKLDRFSSDTLYGQPIFQNGIKFGDGTIQNTAIASPASDHNDLLNIQGGASGEYYHLTAVQASSTTAIDNLVTPTATRIGISSATPTHTLSVGGDVNISGKFYQNGVEFVGGGSGVATSTAIVDGSPIGSIIAYSTTTAPEGYLYCNGASVSTTTYSALFAITGYRYGGTGANFNLPDMRGMFSRGVDDGRGLDPESTRVIGSTETDTLQGHYHNLTYLNTLGSYNVGGAVLLALAQQSDTTVEAFNHIQSPKTDGVNGTPRTSVETRPENIAVAYHIKYAHVGSVSISSTSFLVNSTNTFTGANTFTSSVTLPTRDKIIFGNDISNIQTGVIPNGTFTQTSHIICQSTRTITTQGNTRIRIVANGTWKGDKAAYIMFASYLLDGVAAASGTHLYSFAPSANNLAGPLALNRTTGVVSAGVHNVCLSLAIEATATGTIINDATYTPEFYIEELR